MRFKIHDEDGSEVEVEEVESTVNNDDDTTLTSDEILALKKLASISDKLCALTIDKTEKDEPLGEDEDEKCEECEDEDKDEECEECEDEDENEIVIDTCKSKDSIRRGATSLEKHRKIKNDSVENSIENAWIKRYGR